MCFSITTLLLSLVVSSVFVWRFHIVWILGGRICLSRAIILIEQVRLVRENRIPIFFFAYLLLLLFWLIWRQNSPRLETAHCRIASVYTDIPIPNWLILLHQYSVVAGCLLWLIFVNEQWHDKAALTAESHDQGQNNAQLGLVLQSHLSWACHKFE